MSIRSHVSNYMSPHPFTLDVSATTEQARTAFTSDRFTVAPVIDSAGRAVGVISATDLMANREALLVTELMTRELVAASPHETVAAAASLMTSCRVHHVLVVDDAHRPTGVLSNVDVVRALVDDPVEQPVSWIMSEEVVTLDRGATAGEASDLLTDAGLTAAPVVEQGRVVGLLERMHLVASEVEPSDRVDSLMDERVRTVESNTPIHAVADIIVDHGIRRLVVVDESGECVGVVTASDLAGYAATLVLD